MDTISLSDQVQEQINTKELLHLINYFNNTLRFKGFDNLRVHKMSSRDDDNFGTMVTQTFEVVLFYKETNTNTRVVFRLYRAKSWACSNSSHTVIS